MSDIAASPRPVEGRLRSLAAVYRAVIRNSMIATLQYRVNTMIELVLMVAEPVVYLVVWQIVARASGGVVDGFTPGRFAAYFIVWSLVRTFIQSGSPLNWEHWVRNGTMSGLLLRPIHPVHQDLGLWTGFGIIRAAMWIPAGVVLVISFGPDFDTGALQIGVFAISLSMALVMRTLINDTIGAASFWFTRIGAISSIVVTLELLTGGRLVPPELMPGWAQAVSWGLPFRWTFAFPIEALIGPISPGRLFVGLAMQAVWLVGILILLRLVWRRGIRRYSAVGG
jgi:ABC-2 type transport system permease protein